jgi:hypothetical protein
LIVFDRISEGPDLQQIPAQTGVFVFGSFTLESLGRACVAGLDAG